MKIKLVFYLIITVIYSCGSTVKPFKFNLSGESNVKFTKYFNKEIFPLKKDWNELYLYLKNGHLLKEKGNENYIYSYSLYLLLKRNSLKIYDTEYLNDFNSFVKVFGKPRYKWVKDGKVFISYFQTVVGDPCYTCHHSGFGYTFDEETEKLLME